MQTQYTRPSSAEALIKWRVAGSNIERIESSNTEAELELDNITTSIEDANGAKLLLEHLKNYKLEKRKDFILGVINSALKDIFEADYRLDIQPRETKGSAATSQKYDIIFWQNDIEIARNNDLLTSNGGGVLSIASLFFKILIGYLYSKNKFYIFDESLSQVSPQYRARLSNFLRKFCEEYDFTLVVVSQTEELEEHAHLVYEVQADIDSDRIPLMSIKETQGEIPKENFFYSRVKNFQSIKDATFVYKGFTIIRGPNNSGKSASLRAIEALLFNNFKTDTYPRKGKRGLITDISFGYQGSEGTPAKEIGLKYKQSSSGKVMFVIEGEEYYGKSLAGDKLKEAVEEIGFKYIDVKSMYKNFKGPLKDQTERIAYTNQYDGLFLIGAKTSDSEKIFSFLFNTEDISLAIARLKEDILEMNKKHKELQIEIFRLSDELKEAIKQQTFYIKIYYWQLIQEKNELESNIKLASKKAILLNTSYSKTQAFISAVENSNWIQSANDSLSALRNKELSNSTQTQKINTVLRNLESYIDINDFIVLHQSKQKYAGRQTTINQLEPKLKSLITFDEYTILGFNLANLYSKQAEHTSTLQSLNTEFNLCECSTCSGLGVVPF